ncbi:hypothetical protein H4R33_000251 [Dimargaris cristalligena]|uniref:WD40-repeat-containing domain protein n=1 Tax=Dimargaris cristalligena TaxID=215637 RepID=A0A4P9ZZ79_9FUNG|nr:hypothetical protein H4R33_000251 [Dimargaris cristalligena]RKP39023.1 WD40-repeat-containing domain protein [Dimargaris cristalligena]|eukprot:RKP39023.1 WD40-repeat-containing domain protein [Dimargaris cristalligena]
MSTRTTQHLPCLTVQADWQKDILDIAQTPKHQASFWLSEYQEGEPAIHGTIHVKRAPQALYRLTGKDFPRNLTPLTPLSFAVAPASPGPAPAVRVCAPYRFTTSSMTGPVRSFDVAPTNPNTIVLGGDHGQMQVIDAAEGGVTRATLRGHQGDITICRLFPSGQVVLSGAMDGTLRIWSAEDGSNPVVLRGHTAAITDVAIRGVGRTVLSASSDGSVRLWECGTQRELALWDLSRTVTAEGGSAKPDDQVCKITLGQSFTGHDPRAGHQGTLCVAVTKNGMIYGLDTSDPSAKPVFAVQSAGATGDLSAVAFDTDHSLLVVGSDDGLVEYWDTKSMNQPLGSFRRNRASIHDMVFLGEFAPGRTSLALATADGLASVFSIPYSTGANNTLSGPADVYVTHELTGTDIDPLYTIRVLPQASQYLGSSDQPSYPGLAVAGRDTVIKQY